MGCLGVGSDSGKRGSSPGPRPHSTDGIEDSRLGLALLEYIHLFIPESPTWQLVIDWDMWPRGWRERESWVHTWAPPHPSWGSPSRSHQHFELQFLKLENRVTDVRLG